MSSIATVLHTARLTLVPASAKHIEAELGDVAEFARMLEATVPASWPPGQYDVDAKRFFLERLTMEGAQGIGWFGWYAVTDAKAPGGAMVIAAGGYFGPPDGGVVEMGYSVCPEWRGKGYGTEVVRALAPHALAQPGVTQVIAHTTAANPASIAVLERSGFVAEGAGAEPGTVLFRRLPE